MTPIPPFQAPYAPADEDIATVLLAAAPRYGAAEARIDGLATRLIAAIRAETGGLGGIEDFLHAYSLSTKEGLALMVLAEALLRVPDAATADRLIEDKLAAGDWWHTDRAGSFLVSASAWTLGVTARVIQPGETPDNILESLVKRLGLPAVRGATRQAMRLLGSHFVLGQTIEEALKRAAAAPGFRYSFDMLGEARAPLRMPRAISHPMPRPSMPSGGTPRQNRCRTDPASRSSSRRFIRALRRSHANA